MGPSDLVLVKCELARGGFSSERVFWIGTASGDTVAGVADLSYCFTLEQKPLGQDQPPAGKRVKGLVAARTIRQENGSVLISVPDGTVISVPSGLLVQKEG